MAENTELSRKTVLITGAGGFIGLNIVKAFYSKGYKVLALVHKNIPQELKDIPNIEILQADVTDESTIAEKLKKPDFVVHAAGLASDIGSDETFRKINFEPVKFLSTLAKEKFIFISSTDVYGIKDFHGEDENTEFEPKPLNPYPKYKIEAEKWITKYLEPSKYVIIRPAAVWGENDETLEKRVAEFLEVSPFIIHFGKWKGKNRWPLAKVENVANTCVAAALTNEFDGKAVNIIDEKYTTIDEYYKNIAKKYFPDKSFKTICLPMWVGYPIGAISTYFSNILKLKKPLFDPTLYSLRHVSSNLDFSGERMRKAISILNSKDLK